MKIKIYKIKILFVFCVCETWSLTLRREYRLRVFENRVLRRIFGPKREEVAGRLRKLCNNELIICTQWQEDREYVTKRFICFTLRQRLLG
jgi:hypothetical protein